MLRHQNLTINATKLDESSIKIECLEPDLYYELDSHMAIFKKGYQMSPAYKNHIWDGKIHFFSLKYRILPIGLLSQLLEFCTKNSYGLNYTSNGQTYRFRDKELKSITNLSATGSIEGYKGANKSSKSQISKNLESSNKGLESSISANNIEDSTDHKKLSTFGKNISPLIVNRDLIKTLFRFNPLITKKDLYSFLDTEINLKLAPRDYQVDATLEALNSRRGILECCTGSGKSLIIYMIIRFLLKKELVNNILLTVPSISLVDQMYNDFIEYGWEDAGDFCETQYGGHRASFDKPILITTWQSLLTQDRDFFEKLDCIIGDECHGLRGVKQSDMFGYAKNATFKIGTTGTMPPDKLEEWKVRSVLGEILYKITAKELIDKGILAKIVIVKTFLKYPKELISKNKFRKYPDEVRLIEGYSGRFSVLDVILSKVPKEHNILILCNHLDHLKKTIEYIEKLIRDDPCYEGWKVHAIQGSVNAGSRRDICENVEEEGKNIIVATYGTMSTGVDLKRIQEIVLFANSKSKITVLQSLGRGLRKHPDKRKVVVFDIIDDLRFKNNNGKIIENYLYKHGETRYKYYKEQAFDIGEITISI